MKLLDTVPTVFVGKQYFVSTSAEPQISTRLLHKQFNNGATGPGDTLNWPRCANADTRNQEFDLLSERDVGLARGVCHCAVHHNRHNQRANPCVFSVLIFLDGTVALTASRPRALAIGVTYIANGVFSSSFLSALRSCSSVRIHRCTELRSD